ncbi:M20 family metallopeptidase [Paenibacillus sp. GCM10023252]|uniref:M20 family metallopeptidase n=1 Tax=Paenibacillus sp. GCM10023252 TaxID=3252649 RepID=UPI003623C481
MNHRLMNVIEEHRDLWVQTSRKIWDNPELGHEEFQAAKLLTSIAEKYGFHVETGSAGLPTAFRAIYDSGKPGPTLAYLSEYDALPGLGHACGHNLIGVMSLGAAISLRDAVNQYGGKVILFGTPAEETSGGKVTMAEQGYFEGVDAAMMAHPYHSYERSGKSLAMEAIQFDYYGRTAHAASQPQNGINALDAVIQTFNSINALRQHVTKDVRIHGIITKGGEAANIVPDRTQAQFYVRTGLKTTLTATVEKVRNCAKAAALATGCRVEISNYELGYDNLVTNEALSSVFVDQLLALGVKPDEIKHGLDHGSLDMGNVSHQVPAIHPYIQVPNCPYGVHTIQFRDAVGGPDGEKALMTGIKALAATGLHLLQHPEKLIEIQREFAEQHGIVNSKNEVTVG